MSEEKQFGGHTLAELRALEQAATPGPWKRPWGIEWDEDGKTSDVLGMELRGPDYTQRYGGKEIPHVSDHVCSAGIGSHGKHVANLAFIAAARNALPELLVEVERLKRERDEARAHAARLREALLQWTASCIEEGDLRLLMSSLSGRVLDNSDIAFSQRYGAGLQAARSALAETPAQSLEAVRDQARLAVLDDCLGIIGAAEGSTIAPIHIGGDGVRRILAAIENLRAG